MQLKCCFQFLLDDDLVELLDDLDDEDLDDDLEAEDDLLEELEAEEDLLGELDDLLLDLALEFLLVELLVVALLLLEVEEDLFIFEFELFDLLTLEAPVVFTALVFEYLLATAYLFLELEFTEELVVLPFEDLTEGVEL